MFAFGGRPTRLRTGFGDTTRTKHGKVASLCRTRDAVQGARSGLKSDGAAVTIMMELMSCHSMLPKHPPLALYRSKAKVVTWRYSQATQPLRQMVTESGGDPDEPALHALRIRGAFALAAGGTVSERVIQREGRWKSGAYKGYTGNNERTSVKCRGNWQTREWSLRDDWGKL